MKRFTLLLCCVVFYVLGVSPAYASKNTALRQSENAWYREGQAILKKKLKLKLNKRRAKNVILFIADGNGA